MRRFDFTTTIIKGDAKKVVELEVEAYRLENAYYLYHEYIEKHFPGWLIISNLLGS